MGYDSRRRRREVAGDETCSSSKKQKLMTMMGLERTQKLFCWGILQGLIDHRLGSVALQIPDSQEVRRPMDLSTVRSKLERDGYSRVDAFAADVRLTFSNALWYYPPGVKERAMAKNLSHIFEAKWKLGIPPQTKSASSVSPLLTKNNKEEDEDEDEAKRSSKGENQNLQEREKAKQCRTQRLREKARKDILKIEKAAKCNYENSLQDLQQLELLCRGRRLTLDKLGLYLKRDGFDEDEFLDGDWEEGEIRC